MDAADLGRNPPPPPLWGLFFFTRSQQNFSPSPLSSHFCQVWRNPLSLFSQPSILGSGKDRMQPFMSYGFPQGHWILSLRFNSVMKTYVSYCKNFRQQQRGGRDGERIERRGLSDFHWAVITVESGRLFSDLRGIAGSISLNNHFVLRAAYAGHCWALESRRDSMGRRMRPRICFGVHICEWMKELG